jgi:hypothetical protein
MTHHPTYLIDRLFWRAWKVGVSPALGWWLLARPESVGRLKSLLFVRET